MKQSILLAELMERLHLSIPLELTQMAFEQSEVCRLSALRDY